MHNPDATGSADRMNWLISITGSNRNEIRRLAGIKGPSLYHLHLGRHGLRANTWASLAAVFGVTLDWLLTGAGEQPDPAHVLRSIALSRERSANQTAA